MHKARNSPVVVGAEFCHTINDSDGGALTARGFRRLIHAVDCKRESEGDGPINEHNDYRLQYFTSVSVDVLQPQPSNAELNDVENSASRSHLAHLFRHDVGHLHHGVYLLVDSPMAVCLVSLMPRPPVVQNLFSSCFDGWHYTGNFGIWDDRATIIFHIGRAVQFNVIAVPAVILLGIICGALGMYAACCLCSGRLLFLP